MVMLQLKTCFLMTIMFILWPRFITISSAYGMLSLPKKIRFKTKETRFFFLKQQKNKKISYNLKQNNKIFCLKTL